jgi:hypothetical protein
MVTEAPAGRWLEYLPLSVLEAAEANPKDHDDGAIAESIDRFGFIETPVIDERTGRLVAGHGRTADLRRREALGEAPADGIVVDEGSGVWLVPVVRGWRSFDDDEALAAGIALNRTGELGGWKIDTLAEVLARVERTERGFDGVGFATSNLDELLATVSGPAPLPARKAPVVNRDPDDAPDPPAAPISTLGTVWRLGPHRLVCADSTKPGAYDLLGLDGPAALVWTDPPYGVSYVGKTADALTIESDALSPDELREQLSVAAGSSLLPLVPCSSSSLSCSTTLASGDKPSYGSRTRSCSATPTTTTATKPCSTAGVMVAHRRSTKKPTTRCSTAGGRAPHIPRPQTGEATRSGNSPARNAQANTRQ